MKIDATRINKMTPIMNGGDMRFDVGTILTAECYIERMRQVIGVEPGHSEPDDVVIFKTSTGLCVRIKVRDLIRYYKTKNGGSLFTTEGTMPDKIQIIAYEDRKDRDGECIYNFKHYNGFEDFLHSQGRMSYDELKSTGLKDNCRAYPLQWYTVEILG